jgi:hypothetical protein
MRDHGPIILGDRSRRKKSLGVLRRRLQLAVIGTVAVMFVSYAVEVGEERTRHKQALLDIYGVAEAATLFRIDNGRCPEGVAELAAPPRGEPYVGRTRDPWGTPYGITCPGRRDPNRVDVVSAGPDQTRGGGDNISSL